MRHFKEAAAKVEYYAHYARDTAHKAHAAAVKAEKAAHDNEMKNGRARSHTFSMRWAAIKAHQAVLKRTSANDQFALGMTWIELWFEINPANCSSKTI